MRMQSHLKKPTLAIPSTMIIIPRMNRMVSQLMPLEVSAVSAAEYQKPGVKKQRRFNVSQIAEGLRMAMPMTPIRVSRPHARVMTWRSQISVMIRMNIARKITIAKICAAI